VDVSDFGVTCEIADSLFNEKTRDKTKKRAYEAPKLYDNLLEDFTTSKGRNTFEAQGFRQTNNGWVYFTGSYGPTAS
jgi:hypothetical protein